VDVELEHSGAQYFADLNDDQSVDIYSETAYLGTAQWSTTAGEMVLCPANLSDYLLCAIDDALAAALRAIDELEPDDTAFEWRLGRPVFDMPESAFVAI